MPTITVIIADTHIGGSTALCTPEFEYHTGRQLETHTAQASRAQLWIWDCWREFWAYVWRLAAPEGKKIHRIVTVHLGDAKEGNHHNTMQLMPEAQDQDELAYRILEPIRSMSDRMYAILGTETHAGNNHGNEIGLYKRLELDSFDHQLTLNIDGLVMDFAHHSPAASLPNLYKTLADYPPGERPRYIFRGHRHVITDTGEEHPDTRMIVCPSWQLKTDYAWRVDTRRRSDIGGVIVRDGMVDMSKARYAAQPDRRVIINV